MKVSVSANDLSRMTFLVVRKLTCFITIAFLYVLENVSIDQFGPFVQTPGRLDTKYCAVM